jgi:site-specific DNA recombinase
MRAAVYTRISNDPTGEKAGVARQLDECLALANRWELEVVQRYEDNDISAYNGACRPGFEQLVKAIRRGEFDVLVCWHTDRLYRSIRDMERVIEACEAAGVPIRTVNGGDLDLGNATGKAVARILGSVSRMESEHKAERQRTANIQRAAAGGWWSSHRCFGYTQRGEVFDPEAKAIRKAAADVLDGKSLRQISREWNAQGFTSTRGSAWNNTNLKRVLINPRYAALRMYRGTVTGPGDWVAIVDAETYAGVLAVLRDESRGTQVSFERKYIGSHRYLCGVCGAPMHYSSAKAGGRYVCTKTAHLARLQDKTDAYVESVVLAYLRNNPKLHERLAEDRNRNRVDVPALRERRRALATTADGLATLFTEGVLDGPGVRRESAKLAGQIAAIDAELAEVARNSPASRLLEDGLEELEQRWSELSPDLKGKIIDELVVVTVNPTPRGNKFRTESIDIQPRTT